MLKGRYQENDKKKRKKEAKCKTQKKQEIRKRLENKFALFEWTGSEGLLSQMR